MEKKAFILTTHNDDPWAVCGGTYLITGVKNKREAKKSFLEGPYPKGFEIKDIKPVKSGKTPKIIQLQDEVTE